LTDGRDPLPSKHRTERVPTGTHRPSRALKRRASEPTRSPPGGVRQEVHDAGLIGESEGSDVESFFQKVFDRIKDGVGDLRHRFGRLF